MRPAQLDLIVRPSGLRVHPDGTWAVVATGRPSFEADAYVGQIWRVPLAGHGVAHRLTRGQADTAPRFSPDGRLVGFLRPDADGKPQLHVVEASGGEPLALTDQTLGVGEFVFSPDSRSVAFISRVADDGRYGTLEGVAAKQEDPRRFSAVKIRMNGVGYTTDKRKHVFLVHVPDLGAEPPVKPVGRVAKQIADAAKDSDAAPSPLVPHAAQLTAGDYDASELTFSADGRHLLFTSARHDTRDRDLVSDIYELPVTGGEPVSITPGAPLSCGHPVVSDGNLYALGEDLGESGLGFVGALTGVHLVAGGKATRLTDTDTSVLDLQPGENGTALAIVNVRGTGVLHRIRADGHDDEMPAPGSVLEVAEIPGTPDAAVILADETGVGEVVRLGPLGDATVITDFSHRLRDETAPVRPQELVSTSDDGYPVHGWVFVPAGEGPHPVLLNIHGGPAASYGPAWFDEAQVYVSAGYAVVLCNPRGSDGYGADHVRAIRGAFGDRDMADILGFLDHAVNAVPGLDGERVGVMGGSYGGYMTAWIIAHDHRWAGAIVERGFLDPWSFVGSSDIGWFFPREYNGTDKATIDAQSPMLLTGRVTTPTLVLHSEDDLRCPISQGLQYYTQLKLGGVESELLVFPGETHELSRAGTPWHRRQRFEAILDWWKRHLPVQA